MTYIVEIRNIQGTASAVKYSAISLLKKDQHETMRGEKRTRGESAIYPVKVVFLFHNY